MEVEVEVNDTKRCSDYYCWKGFCLNSEERGEKSFKKQVLGKIKFEFVAQSYKHLSLQKSNSKFTRLKTF